MTTDGSPPPATFNAGPAGSGVVLSWRGQMETRREHLLAELAANPPVVDPRVVELQEIEALLGRPQTAVGGRVVPQVASEPRRGPGRPPGRTTENYALRARLLAIFADGQPHNIARAALEAGYTERSSRTMGETVRATRLGLERVQQGVFRLKPKTEAAP